MRRAWVLVVAASCSPTTERAAALPVPCAAPSDARDGGGGAPTTVAREPGFALTLAPVPPPDARIRVRIEVTGLGPLRTFRVAAPPGQLADLAVSDGAGAVPFTFDATPEGSVVTLARGTTGPLTLTYARAGDGTAHDPLSPLVLEDRARLSGEGVLLLPDGLEDVVTPVAVTLDGSALRAPDGASTLGVGSSHDAKVRVGALRGASFLFGSMGTAVFEAPDGRDAAAWLGYTAFDPRPAVAELALVRTSIGELFRAPDLEPRAVLFFAHARPVGSFTTHPRAGGALVQLGPSEPWSAHLRLALTQQTMRRWIGRDLRVATGNSLAETYWLTEGVARYASARLLRQLGLLSAEDARDVIAGALSALATSGQRGEANATLAARASADPRARAHLAARGLLYAARVGAAMRTAPGGETFEGLLRALFARAREARARLPAATWEEEVAKRAPSERGRFEETILRGVEPTLPRGALGPCFREGEGEWVTFDLGFDAEASFRASPPVVTGLRQGGAASRAGVREGDRVESLEYREGDPSSVVKISLARGGEQVALTYAPRGASRRGRVWTRVPGIPDDRCGDLP